MNSAAYNKLALSAAAWHAPIIGDRAGPGDGAWSPICPESGTGPVPRRPAPPKLELAGIGDRAGDPDQLTSKLKPADATRKAHSAAGGLIENS